MSELTQHAGDWADRTQETLAAEIQQTFLKKEIQTLQEVFQEVNNSGMLQDLLSKALSEIRVDSDACRFTLWGFEPDVKQDYIQCEALVNEVETKLKRKRDSVSDSVQLDTFRSVFLRANRFQEAVKVKYPQLNVTVGLSDVKLHGLVEDIKSTKLLMFEEFLNKQVTAEYKLPPVVLKLLRTKQTRDVVVALLKEANVRIVWDAGKSYLKVSALSQGDVDKGWGILRKAIIQTPVMSRQGESNYQQVLKLAKWQQWKQQLESHYEGLLTISQSDGNLVITCVAGICDTVKENIHNFLSHL